LAFLDPAFTLDGSDGHKELAMSLFSELKRRNVIRVGGAYVVTAWLVIQVVETIFPAFGFGDSAVRIATIVFAIGLIPTLIFSWVFELTPEGLKKESEIDRSQSITPYTGKRLDRMIMVVLALALGYFAFDNFILDPRREAGMRELQAEQLASATEQARQAGRTEALVESFGDKSIAVLPFVNMSSDEEQEYFSDGISEELLNLLARIPELRVISRSSAFSFKGKDIEIPEIARRLNVSHILEGSVRKSGNRVRITAQLIEARSDTHLWSETYERTLDDVFVIQDEISATVVDRLKITLLGDAPHVQETDPEAYALYLQARHLGLQFTAEGLQQSSVLYRRALAVDPGYAAAWNGLANNYIGQANGGLLPADEAFQKARAAVAKALAADPDYAPAHSHLGWISMIADNDLAAAARHFERALALDPTNTDIIGNVGSLLFFLGRLEQSIALNEYANARDPVNSIGLANLGYLLLVDGRWDEAIATYETALRLSPDYLGAHFFIGVARLLEGDAAAALASMQREDYEVYRLLGQAMAYHALGDAVASDTALSELMEKYEREWAYNIAVVLAYRNEADRAFAWLEKSVKYKDPGLGEVVRQPLFRNISDDARWLPFLESIGKAPAQLDAIEFRVTLPSAQ
jgi:TolB-like protein/Tfp pilus assembly protein PilF